MFAFGLLAFGFLGMGPVTIAVDSYGPVTDNAQSVFELSQIEQVKPEDFQKEFGLQAGLRTRQTLPRRKRLGRKYIQSTAKPVLIGTAVIGATTMIFSIILLLHLKLDLARSACSARFDHRWRRDLLVHGCFDASGDDGRLSRRRVHQEAYRLEVD